MVFWVIIGAVMVFFLIFYSDVLLGIRCPVCHSTRHWENIDGKAKRYFDDLYCSRCQRVIYLTKPGRFKVFDEAQKWFAQQTE